MRLIHKIQNHKIYHLLLVAIELGLLSFVVLRINAYFFTNPDVAVLGYDYLKNIEGYYLWQNYWHCGTCVFWDGLKNGGSPALADFVYGLFNPVFVLPALAFGARVGGLVSMGAGFLLCCWSQWWISKVLRHDFFTRATFAILAGIGGHVVGPLLNDWVLVQVSVGLAYAVVACCIWVFVEKNNKSVVALGVVSAFLVLAGNGYMQMAILTAVFPAVILTMLISRQYSALWRFFKATIIVFAITLTTLYNQFSYMGEFVKHSIAELKNIGSINSIHLLFNQDFLLIEKLMNQFRGLPGGYFRYLGLIVVILAVVGLIKSKPKNSLGRIFLPLILLFNFYLSNGELFNFLSKKLSILVGFTNFPLFFNLSLITLVILASEGCAYVCWRMFVLVKSNLHRHTTVWGVWKMWFGILFVVLMYFLIITNLITVQKVTKSFFGDELVQPRYQAALKILQKNNIEPRSSGWIQVPSNSYTISLVLEKGYKLVVDPNQIASVANRKMVTPSYIVWDKVEKNRNQPYEIMSEDLLLDENNEVALYRRNASYASVVGLDAVYPCGHVSNMGRISLECPQVSGLLTVQENNFPGWRAYSESEKLEFDKNSNNLQIAVKNGGKIELSYTPPKIFSTVLLQISFLMIFILIVYYEKRAN